ncbi:hypothetical protein [Azospirillum argentinense]|uniref:Uncharacterized protein n=1 Tax=Azospirillum brasilense TaxID=192 RepID=A0A4D8PYZ6_AZOBR|nr:hypothetical protein [Azospirillum argentinense]QCO00959.1 hypothetical protein D3867_02145 [Azospirillum argentinense]
MAVEESSKTLGRLEASVEELTRQCRALFAKNDESTAQLHTVAATVEQLAEVTRDLRMEVAELRRARDRGVGFMTALTLAGGSVGAVAAKLLAMVGGPTPGH